jgi:excisionase family DNA binding protein
MMLTTKEVAEILKCHQNTVRLYVKSGALKASRIGRPGSKRMLRFKQSDVDKFTKQGGK